jgi:chromosome segregation ATPase
MSAFEKPAPSPAPAGVAPWPTVQECKSEFAKGSGGIYPAFNTPGEYGIKAMHALFERGRRTRDERIAELERERDELLAKMGTHLEHHIQGADAMQNLLDEKRATIATLTKERDEAREELDRASKTAFDAVGSFGGAVCDKINALNSRDAALARVAELTKERDIIKSIAAQAQDRVAELEQVTRDDCGLKTELGMTRASLDTARLAADTFLSECRRHKADNRELKRKIAQLEARESERMKVSVDATVAELEKRVAVDVDACAREIAERIQVDTLNDGDACWGSGVWAEIIRKHTRDVRRITREEARVVYQLLPHTTWDDTIAALRAIGFEVEQ